MKIYKSIAPYIILGAAAFWSLISVLGNRALVMGDELAFYKSVLVEPLSASNPAGYLYDIVYSSSALCGDGYYACVKTINWLFLLGFAGVVVAVAIYLGVSRNYSLLFGTAVLLSPIAVRTSFFMPDVMFYAFAIASVASLFIWMQSRSRNWLYMAAAIAGLTMAVKPHGVFLVIGLILAVGLMFFKDLRSFWKELVIYAVISFGLRLGIGLLAAGTAGLGLFTGYAGDGAASALASSVENVTSNETRFEVAVEFGLFALLAFIAGLIILTPGLFGALLQSSSGKVFETNPSKHKQFLYFTLLVFLSQAAAFTLFVFYAASGGESFENRVVFRYVEFLIPLIVVAILANYTNSKGKFKMNAISFAFLGLTIAAIVYALVVFGDGINIRYADSGFTFLFSNLEILSGAILLLVLVSMLQFLGVESVIRRATYVSLLALFPVLGVYTNVVLNQTTATLAPLDEGSDALRIAYQSDPVDAVYIIAPSKGEAQYMQMKSGVVDSTYLIADSPGVGNLPIEDDEAWVLSVGPHEFFEGNNGFRKSGSNYSLERITQAEIHYFGSQMLSSPIASFEGFENLNSRYGWFASESPEVIFEQDLSNYRSMTITYIAAQTLTGGEIQAFVNDQGYTIPLPATAGNPARVTVEFDGNQSGNALYFGAEERSLIHGIGVISIELNR